MKKLLVLALILSLFGSALVTFAQDDSTESTPEPMAETAQTPEELCARATPQEGATREYAAAPENVLDLTADYHAVFCTEYGPVVVNLLEDVAPVAVNNFVFLADNGYYDGLTFHRVIADFMVQGGDPLGTGTGGPGYNFRDEFVTFMVFDRPGLLAMANSGANTNGSQFFITTVVTDWLNYKHTIFGEVVYGQDTVEAIPVTEVQPQTLINTIQIITDPSVLAMDYAPTAPATREDFAALLETLPELNGVVPDVDLTGVFDPADYVAVLPSSTQSAASSLFEAHSPEYVVSVAHVNAACDMTAFPFEMIGYQVYVFGDEDSAYAASQDENFRTLLSQGNDAESITTDFFNLNGVTWDASTMCDVNAQGGATYRVLGRFLIVTEAVYDVDAGVTVQDLDGLDANLYEAVFFDVLRAEVSQ